ncbi:hypothetical protein LCGC14_0223000 [marine sediment metagenome]|uniref:Uncharacterized protein n=1 Tax=marine sediment metagenome TaxID=412755 RepID=A0A0F9UT77_9ZZZZ
MNENKGEMMDNNKGRFVIKNIELICEKCGKPILLNTQAIILYTKLYHFKCGYNN